MAQMVVSFAEHQSIPSSEWVDRIALAVKNEVILSSLTPGTITRAHELIIFAATRIGKANRVDDLCHNCPIVLQELRRVQSSAVNGRANVRQSSAIPVEDERILIGGLIFTFCHFSLDFQRLIDESIHANETEPGNTGLEIPWNKRNRRRG